MAIIREMVEGEWNQWLAGRPESIRNLAALVPPDRLYRLKSSKHRCTIEAYCEDGTLSVAVTGEFNRVLFSRKVFGIKPEDLEECDLPAEGEDLGDTAEEAGYTEEDVRKILIPRLKAEKKEGKEAG